MQFAKDSFYATLSARLSQLNPSRTICIDGITRSAVVVGENELISAALPNDNTYYIIWRAVQKCDGFESSPEPLMKIECSIVYGTTGSREDAVDRGRTITELDSELLQICLPAFTDKCDYANLESRYLGSSIFWTTPEIVPFIPESDPCSIIKQNAPVFHVAKLTVFFYPEVA
jgi:hypothetical protein